MKTKALSLLLLIPFFLFAQEDYKDPKNKETLKSYTHTTPHDVKELPQINSNKAPKNIILMISDGMGTAHFYASLTANRGKLHILNMKYMGLHKTHSSDNYITDSAAGGTALSSGVKTNNGAIGVDSEGRKVPSILEQAEDRGKATGLVSTSSIVHATPASFIAHQPKRSMYEEIAADFLLTDIDVMIGGGYNFFTERKDQRDLVQELKEKDYTVSENLDEMSDFTQGKLAVFTAKEHNKAYPDRGEMLPDATDKAIEVLNNNSNKGFFLMVEGSQIDWGAHKNNISFIIKEQLDFDRAVGKALDFAAKDGNTLVIVTADHETGGLTLKGGDETTGYVKAEFSSLGHTAVGVPIFAYGPGAKEFIGVYENTAVYDKMAKLWKIK